MEQIIKTIMADVFGLKAEDINSETSMKTTPRWDSLKHIELVASLEENFDMEPMSLDEMERIVTYDLVCKVIRAKTA